MFALLLKIIGFGTRRKNIVYGDLVTSGSGSNINISENTTNNTSKYYFCYYLTFIHNFFAFALISWQIVFSLYRAILLGDENRFFRYMFQLIFSAYYFFGMLYFNKDHFYEKIKRYNSIKKIADISSIIIILASLIISSINVANLLTGINVHNYTYIFNNVDSNTSLCVLLFFDTFFSYMAFLTISLTFALLMSYHASILKEYMNNFDNYASGSVNNNKKINMIGKEYPVLRNEFSETVSLTNSFFVTLNIFGVIGLYITINLFKNKKHVYTDILNLVLFFIIEIVYIRSVQYVKQLVSKINDALSSQQFVNSMFRNYNTNRDIELGTSDNFTIEQMKNTVDSCYISVRTIDDSVDWIILKLLTQSDWDTFNILGVKINDESVIQKIFGIIVSFIFAQDIIDLLKN